MRKLLMLMMVLGGGLFGTAAFCDNEAGSDMTGPCYCDTCPGHIKPACRKSYESFVEHDPVVSNSVSGGGENSATKGDH